MAIINGDGNNNSLVGTADDDTINGFAGEDTLIGGLGNDVLDGGANNTNLGFDFVDYQAAASGMAINLTLGTASGGGLGNDTLISIDGVLGSNFNDTIVGTVGQDFIRGLAGNDFLDGGAGLLDILDYNFTSTAINANLTTGIVTGGAGNDTVTGFEQLRGGVGADVLTGEANDNTLRGNAGNDTIDGAGGNDRADYLNAISAVVVSLLTGTATGGDGSDTLIRIERIRGSNFNDTLTGDNGANSLEGAAGNDTLFGNDGGDFITAGLGNDSIDGGLNDIRQGLDWSNNSDAISSVTVNLTLGTVTGGSGTDTLVSIDAAAGGAFNDILTGDANFNFLRGNAGNDTLDGGEGTDLADYFNATSAITVNLATGTATGGDGNDILLNIEGISASDFNDTLIGSAADERFRGRLGNDSIDGGEGIDTIDLRTSLTAVTVNLALGTATGDGNDVFINIENIRGSELAADTLIGNGGDNVLQGYGGNDTLDGSTGIDTASFGTSYQSGVIANLGSGTVANDGWGSTDTLISIENLAGSQQADQLTGSSISNKLEGDLGNDTLNGAGGNDTLEGGAGADSLDGGLGSDLVSYASATSGIQAYFYATPGTGGGLDGDAAGDLYTSIEGVIGSAFADVLVGAAGIANSLDGGAGDDTLYGEGLDSVLGGAGNDVLFGGQGGSLNLNLALAGLETVWGSVVGDTLNAASALTAVTLIGQGGADTMTGGAGDDFLYFDSTDTILGGAGLDWAVATLSAAAVNLNLNTAGFENSWGSTSNDTISGAGASTTVVIIGDVGNDSITGGSATDYLYGFAGNDTLTGGAGGDVLDGGAGSDLFAYANLTGSGFDSIFGFVSGQDKFQFNAASFGKLAGSVLANGVSFISGTAPVAAGATPTVLYNTSTGVVSYDLDGSGAAAAVSIAQLAGVPPVVASDFLFA